MAQATAPLFDSTNRSRCIRRLRQSKVRNGLKSGRCQQGDKIKMVALSRSLLCASGHFHIHQRGRYVARFDYQTLIVSPLRSNAGFLFPSGQQWRGVTHPGPTALSGCVPIASYVHVRPKHQ